MYMYMYMQTYMQMYVYMHMFMYMQMYLYMYTCMCVYIYASILPTHTYIYTHTYINVNMYIHTFVSFFSLFRFSQPIHRIDIPNIYFGWSPLPQAMSLFGKRFVRWRAQLMVGWWVRETSWERTPIDGDFQLCINVITDEKQMENLLDNYL